MACVKITYALDLFEKSLFLKSEKVVYMINRWTSCHIELVMTAHVALSCHLCWMLLVTSSTYEDGTCQLHVPLKCPVGDPGPYVMHGLLPLPIQIFSLLCLYRWVEHLHCSFSNKMTYIHTYTRLMALFPGVPGWAGTRKVKPAGPYGSLHLAPDR